MAGMRTQVDGMNELLHKLTRVLANETRTVPMEALKQRLIKRLATYPPPGGGEYERTGDLGRGWAESGAVRVDAGGTNQFADRISVELANRVDYAAWVQGAETQVDSAREHGWETTQKALDAETPGFVAELTDSIGSAWASG